jgi:hypothetical protein
MSFDVHFQGFVAGESSLRGGTAMREVLALYVVEESGTFLHVRVGDGEADAYLREDGMMVNHVSGRDPWDLLVEGAQAANWVIMPVGGATCLTNADQRRELPDELEADVAIVRTGADLRAVFGAP